MRSLGRFLIAIFVALLILFGINLVTLLAFNVTADKFGVLIYFPLILGSIWVGRKISLRIIPPPEVVSVLAQTPSEEELLDAETKKCSACAENIKLEAFKCRFCDEEFDREEVERQVALKRVEIEEFLKKEREGKEQCPQCGNWDTRWAAIEDGGMGHWCDNCKKSLKAMGAS